MTEEWWLTASTAEAMVQWLGYHAASERKARLAMCAYARRFWAVLRDKQSRWAIECAERFVEGSCSQTELDRSHKDAHWVYQKWVVRSPHIPGHDLASLVTYTAFPRAVEALRYMADVVRWSNAECVPVQEAEQRALAILVREVFGNPFRPIAFDPEWRSDTALSLAKHIYEARDFAQMPILADALQDAGCTNDDILNHLRDPNATHVRGCWALDLVLGKQ